MRKYTISNKAIYAGYFDIGIDKIKRNTTSQTRGALQLKELTNLKKWCEQAIIQLEKELNHA